jgi:hypothetical protein
MGARVGAAVVAAFVVVLCAAAPLHAERRFAVVIGNNEGLRDEPTLRYAEDDATKMSSVLRQVGGFRAEDVVALVGADADEVLRTLVGVNDRLRDQSDAVLFVYYSGHAAADALHIGGTALPLEDVERAVRGSAAVFRVLILDACRTGVLTETKGGRRVDAFALSTPAASGFAILTAAAAGEDAQESEMLRGSFFTHHFASGLRGAADANRDDAITLDEAYRYAYDATVSSSSRTVAGTQHPTYRYDLRGQGSLVVTRLRSDEARLRVPDGVDVLVFDGRGAVVAEVKARAGQRLLAVPAGALAVRIRGTDAVYEGNVTAVRGAVVDVEADALERFEYARLVRKGTGDRTIAFAPAVFGGVGLATAMPSPSIGVVVPVVTRGATVSLQLRYTAATNAFFDSDDFEWDRFAHVVNVMPTLTNALDLGPFALTASSGVGVSVVQNVRESGRLGAGVLVMLGAGVELPLASPFYARLDCQGQLAFTSEQTFLLTDCLPGVGAYF